MTIFRRVCCFRRGYHQIPIRGTITLQSTNETRFCKEEETLFRVYDIIDGQQRITSIIYALYAPEPDLITPKYTSKKYLFFLNLKELEKGNVDDAVFSYSEDDRRVKKLLDKEVQYKEKIIPFTTLRNKDSWDKWIEGFKSYQRKKILQELQQKGVKM